MEKPHQYTFSKAEKLCSKIAITALFKKGTWKKHEDIAIVFTPNEGPHHQFLISVPKRRVKRAVDRNAIKRLIRESVRLNKNLIDTTIHQIPSTYNFGIVYNGPTKANFQETEAKIKSLFNRFKKVIQTSHEA